MESAGDEHAEGLPKARWVGQRDSKEGYVVAISNFQHPFALSLSKGFTSLQRGNVKRE